MGEDRWSSPSVLEGDSAGGGCVLVDKGAGVAGFEANLVKPMGLGADGESAGLLSDGDMTAVLSSPPWRAQQATGAAGFINGKVQVAGIFSSGGQAVTVPAIFSSSRPGAPHLHGDGSMATRGFVPPTTAAVPVSTLAADGTTTAQGFFPATTTTVLSASSAAALDWLCSGSGGAGVAGAASLLHGAISASPSLVPAGTRMETSRSGASRPFDGRSGLSGGGSATAGGGSGPSGGGSAVIDSRSGASAQLLTTSCMAMMADMEDESPVEETELDAMEEAFDPLAGGLETARPGSPAGSNGVGKTVCNAVPGLGPMPGFGAAGSVTTDSGFWDGAGTALDGRDHETLQPGHRRGAALAGAPPAARMAGRFPARFAHPPRGAGGIVNAWAKLPPLPLKLMEERQDFLDDDDAVIMNDMLAERFITQFESALVGRLLGRKIPPHVLAFELRQRWEKYGQFRLTVVNPECFLCVFESTLIRDEKFEYEGLKVLCFQCGCVGHRVEECPEDVAMAASDPVPAAQVGVPQGLVSDVNMETQPGAVAHAAAGTGGPGCLSMDAAVAGGTVKSRAIAGGPGFSGANTGRASGSAAGSGVEEMGYGPWTLVQHKPKLNNLRDLDQQATRIAGDQSQHPMDHVGGLSAGRGRRRRGKGGRGGGAARNVEGPMLWGPCATDGGWTPGKG
ncbi:hypothetical protein KSP40_PGU022048 [Platanthera guangdongensis]|uniref:CCHC-type domain-containing protein n=1 Tax=Platanthera guangdongensis TaxID=2320717 RepID=A0ABR2LY89_9ASPA